MCLRVFTGAPMENLAILDTPHGAGAAELSTVDTENTLLYRQWECCRTFPPQQKHALGSGTRCSRRGQCKEPCNRDSRYHLDSSRPCLFERVHSLQELYPVQICQ